MNGKTIIASFNELCDNPEGIVWRAASKRLRSRSILAQILQVLWLGAINDTSHHISTSKLAWRYLMTENRHVVFGTGSFYCGPPYPGTRPANSPSYFEASQSNSLFGARSSEARVIWTGGYSNLNGWVLHVSRLAVTLPWSGRSTSIIMVP